MDLLQRSPPFSGSIQVDAAAKVDEDEVLCDGGGARAMVGLREEEDEEERRMRKTGACLFISG